MRIIALPLDGDMIHGHFGAARQFKFYYVENGNIANTELQLPPPHTPGAIPRWIVENNVTDLILCGIGQKAVTILEQNNVKVVKGAPIKNADEIVDEYLKGSLENTGEECKGHGHHGEHGHHS